MDYLLLCINNKYPDSAESLEDRNQQIVTHYLATKNSQIQVKFGIAIDSNPKDFANYIVSYIRSLAEEWVKIIVKSLSSSFNIYLNALLKDHETEFGQEYHQLLFREIAFFLQLVQLNDTWNDLPITQSLLEITTGLITLSLTPPKDHEVFYVTMCLLLISFLSKSNLPYTMQIAKSVLE